MFFYIASSRRVIMAVLPTEQSVLSRNSWPRTRPLSIPQHFTISLIVLWQGRVSGSRLVKFITSSWGYSKVFGLTGCLNTHSILYSTEAMAPSLKRKLGGRSLGSLNQNLTSYMPVLMLVPKSASFCQKMQKSWLPLQQTVRVWFFFVPSDSCSVHWQVYLPAMRRKSAPCSIGLRVWMNTVPASQSPSARGSMMWRIPHFKFLSWLLFPISYFIQLFQLNLIPLILQPIAFRIIFPPKIIIIFMFSPQRSVCSSSDRLIRTRVQSRTTRVFALVYPIASQERLCLAAQRLPGGQKVDSPSTVSLFTTSPAIPNQFLQLIFDTPSVNQLLMASYVLYESAIGYALFQVREFDLVETPLPQVQAQIANFSTFSKMVTIHSTLFFEGASAALDNARKLAEGKVSEELTGLLGNIQSSKKSRPIIGIADAKLAGAVSEALGLQTVSTNVVTELLRGVRMHYCKLVKREGLTDKELQKAQLGLGHSLSRNRISLDVNRQDKPIIQGIAILELLDKDVNTLSMRIREWYSWHFPELVKIVPDNYLYIRMVRAVGDREHTTASREEITEVLGSEELTDQVVDAMKVSMGQEISEFDIACLHELCDKVMKLYEFRTSIQGYLSGKMAQVAPNLTQVVGENVGAKLISHAGSLTSLAKCPASTIQILGAEKALFRALKTKGNTPKYGLLYHSSFIGRAPGKDKGKISRFLANKCALAARLDQFLVQPTERFGVSFKQQVERRLTLLAQGGDIDDNEEIMAGVLAQLKSENLYFSSEKEKKSALKKARKSKTAEQPRKKQKAVQSEEEEAAPVVVEKKKKKHSN